MLAVVNGKQQAINSVYRRWLQRLSIVGLFCLLLLSGTAGGPLVSMVEAGDREDSHSPWSFLAGYGTSHPGWGETRTRVQTVELIPRYERIVLDDLGSSWYRGQHSLLLELPIHLITNYDLAPMMGVNFLACWTMTGLGQTSPYLFAGGGPLYTATDIEGMGARVNGNYQVGAGVRYRLDSGDYLLFELRFHHVSNGGRKKPNESLNSSKLLIGVTF